MVRQTKDVDCIVPVDAPFEWHELEERLRAAAFTNDTETVIRFRHDGDVFDFIPYGERMSGLLGFDVRFHREAFESAVDCEIAPNCHARIVSLPYLFVTKVCAFQDRGRSDPYESKDLEDLVVLLMGSEVCSRLEEAPNAVRETVANWARELAQDARFRDWIEGHVPGGPNHDDFVEIVVQAIRELADLGA